MSAARSSFARNLLIAGGSLSILGAAGIVIVGPPPSSLGVDALVSLLPPLAVLGLGTAMLSRAARMQAASLDFSEAIDSAFAAIGEPATPMAPAAMSPEALAFVEELKRLTTEDPRSNRSAEDARQAFIDLLSARHDTPSDAATA